MITGNDRMRYYKTIQITLTEPEYADVMKACARKITETGTPVSVTRYAKSVLMDEVKRITEESA